MRIESSAIWTKRKTAITIEPAEKPLTIVGSVEELWAYVVKHTIVPDASEGAQVEVELIIFSSAIARAFSVP